MANHRDPVTTSHRPGTEPGHELQTTEPKQAAVTFTVDIHHHMLPDFFWRATNELPFLAAIVMILAITTKFAF